MSGRSIADSMRSCSGVLCKRVRFCSNSVWLLRWRRRAFEFRLPGQSASGEAQMPAKVQSAGNRRRMKRYLLLLASNLVLAVAYFASGRFGLSLVALGSPAISATFGVTSLKLGGFAPNYSATWLTWWLGDMVSDLIISPVLMIWSMKRFPGLKPLRLLELSLALGLLILIGQM